MSDLPVQRVRTRPVSSFWSRILVAAAGLPAVIGIVWLGGWWLALLAIGAGLVALHEFTLVTRPLRPVAIAAYAGLICILLGIQLGGLVWGTGGIGVALALAFLLKGVSDTRGSATVAVGTTVLGAAWIGFGLGYLVLLRALPQHGRLTALTVLIAVFAADTAAYFVGLGIGRHKLAPRLSPGKTWEGFVAGVVATIFVVFVALYQDRHTFLSIGQALVLGVVLALVGPTGDLFESSVKRDMRVKDSGRILAGHGGMLDRVDALLFASIAAFYVVRAFGAT
jgi:phosphatidate cytidylyltransferase